MKNRAIRRHHSKRMKAKARGLYVGHPRAEHYADHLTVCSCLMCGNPRRTQNCRTVQELKFEEAVRRES